jgi:hypothetical protein
MNTNTAIADTCPLCGADYSGEEYFPDGQIYCPACGHDVPPKAAEKAGRVLFISRHEMSADQIADCKAIFGDCRIVTQSIVLSSVDELRDIVYTRDWTAVIAVLPGHIAAAAGFMAAKNQFWTRRVVIPVSVPAAAKDGETRQFVHAGFFNLRGRRVFMAAELKDFFGGR